MQKLWHQSYLLVALAAGIVLGTVLMLVTRWTFFESWVWIVVVIIIFGYAFVRPSSLFVMLTIVAGIVLAGWRANVELAGQKALERAVGQSLQIEGIVAEDPDTDESGTTLKMKDLVVSGTKVGGTIFVSMPKNEKIERSDKMTIFGKLSSGFGTYAAAVYRPKIEKIERPEPGDVLLTIRNAFAEAIRQYIPEKESRLGLAYLLGMKNGLTDEMMETLRVVGLSHIVVASGTHLSILVGFVKKIFGKISRFAGLFFSLILIVGFATMIGWTASITRAALVSILSLLMWYVGRKWQPWRLILIVMAITLMINPMYIINLGWLLSFGSFSGILILNPYVTRFFCGTEKPNFLAETLLATISATLFCLPIMLYFFGSISVLSFPANLLILPTVQYAMLLVFATGCVAWWPWLAQIVGWLAKILLDYHLLIMNFLGEQKMFVVEIGSNQIWVFLLYIPILAPIIWQIIRDKKSNRDRR